MGAWDAGPFDNDEAADFASELEQADPNERLMLVREALEWAMDPADEDEEDQAQPRAVAAAAIVAASRPGGLPIEPPYGPDFLAVGDPPEVPDDLVELAALALDRIADSDTEWAELFGEAGTLESMRTALT